MMLLRDPLPSAHRPFWVYLITRLVLPQVTRSRLVRLGFRRYRAGAMTYWLRRGCNVRHSSAASSETHGTTRSAEIGIAPLVFCHGLGVGMLPYIPFVVRLSEEHPEADVFCVDMPHIQMRPCEAVPSAREMCACIQDMLRAWGHTSAHAIGHSFGTIVCSWLAKFAPKAVQSVCFLDPVCFLLCKSDLIFNALYNRRLRCFRDPAPWLLQYLVFKELYICHTLMRNFFWMENNLWPDELLVPSLVCLGGRDALVPAHSVRQMFAAESERRLLASEARRSGGSVVIQSGQSTADSESGSPVKILADHPPARLAKVLFAPQAQHGHFLSDVELLEEWVREVKKTTREGAAAAAADDEAFVR